MWEYVTFSITYDKKKHQDWWIELADGTPVVGLQAILNRFGGNGWELVSLDAVRMRAYPEFGRWGIEPAGYRATFKRAREQE